MHGYQQSFDCRKTGFVFLVRHPEQVQPVDQAQPVQQNLVGGDIKFLEGCMELASLYLMLAQNGDKFGYGEKGNVMN